VTDSFNLYYGKKDSIINYAYRVQPPNWKELREVSELNVFIQHVDTSSQIKPTVFYQNDSIVKIEFELRNNIIYFSNCKNDQFTITDYFLGPDNNYYSKNKKIHIIELFNYSRYESEIQATSCKENNVKEILIKKYSTNDDTLYLIKYDLVKDLKQCNVLIYNNTFMTDTILWIDPCTYEEKLTYFKRKVYK
jgi:hypothetical protein